MRAIRNAVLCCAVLSGCSTGDLHVGTWQVSSDAPLTSLASPESLVVVLVLDPADCLS